MPARKKRSSRKSGATRNTEQQSSSFAWIFMGLLVGAFVVFLIYLDRMPEQNGATVSQKKDRNTSQQSNDSKNRPREHQFDFYTVLPDREVEVIVEDRANGAVPVKTPDNKTPESASSQKQVLYQLQVGAFKSLEKADAMKARLAFMGVESNIQVVQTDSQKIYRVRVGPSTDNRKIEQIQAQLKSSNINSFIQKL